MDLMVPFLQVGGASQSSLFFARRAERPLILLLDLTFEGSIKLNLHLEVPPDEEFASHDCGMWIER